MESFNLGDKVKMTLTDEHGIIVGTASYLDQPEQYLVRYRSGDGRQVQDWWTASAIEKVG